LSLRQHSSIDGATIGSVSVLLGTNCASLGAVAALRVVVPTGVIDAAARMHEQTLHKLDRSRRYPHLDPILDGTVKPHLVPRAWDEPVAYTRRSSPAAIVVSALCHSMWIPTGCSVSQRPS
jgi:hypothetical protein